MFVRSFFGRVARLLVHPGTLVVVAFLIRFGLLYHFRVRGPFAIYEQVPFGYETGRIARALAAGEGYSSPLNVDTGPTAWMTPLYPLLLAGIFKLFGIFTWKSYLVITTVDCALSALITWPVYALGRRAFGEGAAIAGAFLWIALPSAVYFPIAWVWDTTLAAFFFSLIVLATLGVTGQSRTTTWAGYGALWGLGALANASCFSTFPFLLGWAAWRAREHTRHWLRLGAVAAAACFLILSPWFVRNLLVLHRPILFRSNFGLELWLGNNEKNPGIWSWWLHPNDDPDERKIYVRMGEIPYMEMKQKEAIDWMKAHPREFVSNTFHRFVDTWTGFDEPVTDLLHSPPQAVALFTIDVIFPLLTFTGALIAVRRRNPYAFPFAAAILLFPLVYYVTHSSLRYRHPLDSVMCVLAGYTLSLIFSSFRVGRKKPAMAASQSDYRGEQVAAG